MTDDQKWMRIALGCAELGRGAVEPNPMVGCVIVRDGREVGRGWHRRFGGPHAEREAIAAARAAGHELRGATMYVTLEPCCHHGKTPPCTDAILGCGAARVVTAMVDPDEHVAGKGLSILREAGVAVDVGVCEAEARELLRGYIKLRTTGRPWVICKWAQTADGLLALPPGAGRWVSCEESRRLVHQTRSWCDGVLAGIGTVLADDPLLNNRSGAGKQPARVVLDSNLRLPTDAALVRSVDQASVTAVTVAGSADGERAEALRGLGVEVLAMPADESGIRLPALLDELGRRKWTYLLVEGGRAVHESFLRERLADEVQAFVSPDRHDAAPASLPRLDVELACPPALPRSRQAVGRDTLVTVRF